MISSVIAGALARGIVERERADALEQAVKASKAKGDFLSNMSHEIRTPMNAIIGMTTIGKSASDLEKKDYAFERIEDASVHLLGVINDILDMSKIEANKLELSPDEFDFEKMLQKVVNVINFRIEEKKQNFYVNIDKDIPFTLVGDDQRLAQVVTNLLSNAVKFTPEYGSIYLSSRLLEEEDGVYTLQIDVADTGIGITQEQQSRLFKSFEQAESGTSRKFGGTGLGLAISKRIVEMMGGTIWTKSAPGKGTKFSFTIKTRKGERERENFLNRWGNVRVLAVDDAPEVLECFENIALRWGIASDTAISGEKALALLSEKGHYDIYFIDWKMPDMNGIELTRRIRSHGAEGSVVVMLATEWSAIEDEAKAAGVDKFLSKPLFPSSLAECLNECLGVSDNSALTEEKRFDNFEGKCILLAEDVDINREIVSALLEPTKLEIVCAENGAEALRMFKEAPSRYDMVFMDVQMPEMDGYEATREIRALSCTEAKEVPIVAMTANVFKEDIEKCLASGMNDHLGKPLNIDEMLEKLHKYLSE
jgi:CheY-like chemotaxis protein